MRRSSSLAKLGDDSSSRLLLILVTGVAYPLLSAANKSVVTNVMLTAATKVVEEAGSNYDSHAQLGLLVRGLTVSNYFPGLAALALIDGIGDYTIAVLLAAAEQLGRLVGAAEDAGECIAAHPGISTVIQHDGPDHLGL